ncbi:ATP-dependent DNA helicase RecQ [compost metagenome]
MPESSSMASESDAQQAEQATALVVLRSGMGEVTAEGEDLFTPDQVRVALGITTTEYDDFVQRRWLPVARRHAEREAGRMRVHLLHGRTDVQAISPEQVLRWREELMAALTPAARQARSRSLEQQAIRDRLRQVLEQVAQELECLPAVATQGLAWSKTLRFVLTAAGQNWNVRAPLQVQVASPTSVAELEGLVARVRSCFEERQEELRVHLENQISELFATYSAALAPPALRVLSRAVAELLRSGRDARTLMREEGLKPFLGESANELLQQVEAQQAEQLLQLQDYPQAFSLARSMRRRVHFKLGPTNSGKTHEALEALKAASSGVYLAPLRLLAMEVRDRLMAAGVPCNLLTGEEHVLVEGARHTACTVEMMNPTHQVEVAVIDEIQMLHDDSRGWAWTSALVGVPADDVFVCGAALARESCIRVLDALGEEHDTTYLERKTELKLQPLANPAGDAHAAGQAAPKGRGRGVPAGRKRGVAVAKQAQLLAPGDAVIAFSRKDVLTLSARFRQQGLKVATIYGSLAPEVRRTEAERFAAGEAQVVVATDAIGMGLNLPVRRVVFSTVHKFDGVQTRKLNCQEVLQIAGRAGRFGLYPQGFVSAFDAGDLQHVQQMLRLTVPEEVTKLQVAPSLWHIEALAQLLRTDSIAALLSFFARRVAAQSEHFRTAELEDSIALAHEVDRWAPGIGLADKFTFSCAPAAAGKPAEVDYFRNCLRAFAAGRTKRLPEVPGWLTKNVFRDDLLEDAEQLSKDLSLYAWLSFKCPDVYVDGEQVAPLREVLSRYIEHALLRQSGFGLTSKEAREQRGGWD